MATNNWIGSKTGTSNFWQDAANWSGGVPAISNDVAITAAGTYTVVITAAERPYQIKSLHLGAASGTIRLIEDGSLSVIGSANLTHSIFDIGAGGTGSVFGNVNLDAGSTAMTEGVFNVGGAITGTGGTVEVDGGSLFAGAISGSDHYVLSLDGAFEVGGGIAASSNITFADTGADTLVLDSAGNVLNATIAGFGGDNRLDIGSLPFSSQYTTHYSGTTLTISTGAGPVFTIADINNPGSFSLADDGSEGTMLTVCYARGTMIRTPDDEVPVESLKPGDRVMTLSGGEFVPVQVTWVGYRRLNIAAHPRPLLVAPVLIERGAFGDDVPHRDLLVSPDHAILADERLICARQLLNGTTIRQDTDRRSVEYYHVELQAHAIMLAEGLPAESYLDTGNRGFFANADLPCPLHPDLTGMADHPTREANSCMPFATDTAAIRQVWQRLAERAATIGRCRAQPQITENPELRLLVGDRLIKPVIADNRLSTFPLPPGTTEVRLVSRAAAPSDTRPWLDDRRRLGVKVARLVLRSREELHDIPLDHPCLATGWWAVERDGVALRRWTDGDAVLPLPATGGASMLEVRVADTVTYLTMAEMVRAA
jgi:Hint domain